MEDTPSNDWRKKSEERFRPEVPRDWWRTINELDSSALAILPHSRPDKWNPKRRKRFRKIGRNTHNTSP
jgi:hypothetical protein